MGWGTFWRHLAFSEPQNLLLNPKPDINNPSPFIFGRVVQGKKNNLVSIKLVVQPHMATYRTLKFLTRNQFDVVSYYVKKWSLCFTHVKHATLTLHTIYNANQLAIRREMRFIHFIIGHHNLLWFPNVLAKVAFSERSTTCNFGAYLLPRVEG